MRSLSAVLRPTVPALRLLLVLTVVLGVAYPLAVTAVAQLPGLSARADGSLLRTGGVTVGSSLIGQSFTDAKGDALRQYFAPRPSAAGDGYDPTSSGASNLGPESVVDVVPDPAAPAGSDAAAGEPSLLTRVCTRSLEIGDRDGVDGSRPFCSPDGTGSVLALFWSGPGYTGTLEKVVSVNQAAPATPFVATWRGVAVEPASPGTDYAAGQIVPVRGDAPADPAVPADAVTASGSGLDPDISPAYAAIQVARVAAARGIGVGAVEALVRRYSTGRGLSFLGGATVNVVELNLALDAAAPVPR